MNKTPSPKIIEQIKKQLKTRPKPKYLFILNEITLSIFLVVSLIVTFFSFRWLIDQAIVFNVFWPYLNNSISGWVWVFLPEFAVFGIIFTLLIYFLYRKTDWIGVAWADAITTSVLILIITTSFFIPANAEDSIPVIKSTHTAFLNQPYRIWLRDKHIIDLEENNEFYGSIVGITNNSVSIDHGGVILVFKTSNTAEMVLDKRIWVKFIQEGDDRIVTDKKIWN
jgi:hypothetical protein